MTAFFFTLGVALIVLIVLVLILERRSQRRNTHD